MDACCGFSVQKRLVLSWEVDECKALIIGTSMATPVVAGAAILVRQYFVDGYYPSGARRASDGFAPTAALIKATLINGAQVNLPIHLMI